MPGSVDDIDSVPYSSGPSRPKAGRRRGRDGDATLLLLLHPIHHRIAVMDFTDLVEIPVEQDPLSRGGLPASMCAMMPMFR